MAIYNFKKELKLYVVKDGTKHRLDVYPDISFSQTFNETSVPVKTLHTQYSMFEQASITKANPANFNFTIPVSRKLQFSVILDLFLNYASNSSEVTLQTADFYVEMNTDIFKIEKAVIESAVFQIVRNQLITLNCSGTARKLSRVESIPEIGAIFDYSDFDYTSPNALEIKIDDVVKSNISNISLELRNNVDWVEYSTLQESLNVSSASDTQYPEAFVVSGRTLSGNVQQYVTDENVDTVNTWSTGSSFEVRTGKLDEPWLIDITIPQIVFTNRSELQELLMQSFDFRMVSNPTDMSEIIQVVQLTSSLSSYGIWAAI